MKHDSLTDEIQQLLRSRLSVVATSIDSDLVAAGLLDSLALVELFVLLEQRFGFTVTLDDITLDDFRAVSSIAAFVARKSG